MLDRLVRRSVLADADGVMRHNVDHADTHERRKPQRGAAVIGEYEEGAGEGNDAAMQRHAVHRSRHAVFADAPMNKVAGEIVRRDRLHRFGAGVVGAREVGGAADHFRCYRADCFQRVLRSLAGRNLGLLRDRLLLQRFDRGAKTVRQFAVQAALELGLLRGFVDALLPGRASSAEREPNLRQLSRISAGISNGP